MLFMFPGKVLTSDLEADLAPFFDVARRELLYVTDLNVSLLGWRGTSRCQIRDAENIVREIVFDPIAKDAAGFVRGRRPRPGVRICDRPDDLEWSPLASMFGHDD